jgi:hypothetical protein
MTEEERSILYKIGIDEETRALSAQLELPVVTLFLKVSMIN